MTPDTLIDVREVSRRVGFSVAQIYRLVRAGQFPQPTHVLGRATRFSVSSARSSAVRQFFRVKYDTSRRRVAR